MLACILFVFLIAATKAGKDDNWEASWSTNFALYIIMDMFINPFVAWGSKYLTSRIFFKRQKIFDIIEKMFDEKFVEAYVRVSMHSITQ